MKQFILFVLFTALSFTVFGQGPGGPRGQRGQGINLEELKKELSLTDEQIESWKALQEKFRPQMQEIRQDDTLEWEEKREKVRTLMAERQEEVKAMLTEEQLAKLEEIRAENAPRRGKGKRKGKNKEKTDEGSEGGF